MGPPAHIVWEALLSEYLCRTFRVDVVEEAGDVEKEEGPYIAHLSGGLDFVYECGDSVDGVVFWS